MEQLKNIEALLLDLDGTLINSEKAFFQSFKNILKQKYNIDITEEEYKKYELEQNAMLLKTLRQTHESIKDISDKEIMSYIYDDYENEFRKVILEPETISNFNLLKELKKLRVIIALVTTCRRYYLNILINELGLDNLFDYIVAREDVPNLKPSPEAYDKVIEELKLEKEKCLSIEDSKRGIDSAIDSGISVIQVSNFTSIKYIDERTTQMDSANLTLSKLLEIKRNQR